MTADGMIWWSREFRPDRIVTVGLVVRNGTVVDCAPYARRWALGRDAREVWRQQSRAGAELVWLPDTTG